jgi:Tol biopolymer transport system component
MGSRRPRSALIPWLLAAVCVLAGRAAAQEGPRVYGPGVFSTGAWDFFVAFTPDLRTAYICRANGDFSYYTILETSLADGRWSEPRVAAFSGRWSDADPHLSPDGRRLFFISNRPSSGDTPREHHDIWVVERGPGGEWGTPRNLGAPVNRDGATEWSPSVARNGNLYFGTIRDEGKGGNDLYLARWTGDRYAEPENLGDSVNTKAGEFEPWISPDESYLIFSAQGRPDGPGGFDLYVSERRNGIWQRARPLGPVNSPKGDFNHSVSPDGRYLFFSSTRGQFDSMPPAPLPYAEMQRRLTGIGNGLGDIYRIPLAELGIRVGD